GTDRLIGVDLDHCFLPGGGLEEWAQGIVDRLASYTERSPGGHGVRGFCRGPLPPPRGPQGKGEVYSDGRVLTAPGHALPGSPPAVEDRAAAVAALHAELFGQSKAPVPPRPAPVPLDLDDNQIVERASRAANGDNFARLWAGDWSAYSSQSEADLA